MDLHRRLLVLIQYLQCRRYSIGKAAEVSTNRRDVNSGNGSWARPALQPQLWRIIMRELNVNEMEEASGGVAMLAIAYVARKLYQAGWDFEHSRCGN